MKKRHKKSTLEKLQDKAESLWKLAIKSRDKVCQLCTGTKVLQAHHVFSRKNKGLFLDIDNGILLCRVCHCNVTWDDGYKEKIKRVVIRLRGQDTFDRIYEQSLDKTPFLEWKNINYLEEQIDILQSLLRKMEEDSNEL